MVVMLQQDEVGGGDVQDEVDGGDVTTKHIR